jgi:hypothetical protein
MKSIIFCILMSGLFLSMSSAQRANDLYQVISSHPHELEELSPFVETVYQNGRLWVVQLKEGDAPLEIMGLLKPLKGGEKSYLHEAPRMMNLRAPIQTISRAPLNSIKADFIKADVEDLANNYETRFTGSEGNKEAISVVSKRFKAMGYTVGKICFVSDACSVIAEKLGSQTPEKVIMVMGHIDSVGEAFAGADDNASGVAVMLEMGRVLKTVANKKTLRFFISNGEEQGLMGSDHYAKTLDKKELLNLELVINMDMVGYNSNGVVELETEPKFEALAKWYAALALKYTKLKPKITLGAWGSDHVSFLNLDVPAILTIEDWSTKTPCYHMECDKPELLNYNYATEIAKLNVSAVLSKDLGQ